jgi:hypothetical protein
MKVLIISDLILSQERLTINIGVPGINESQKFESHHNIMSHVSGESFCSSRLSGWVIVDSLQKL